MKPGAPGCLPGQPSAWRADQHPIWPSQIIVAVICSVESDDKPDGSGSRPRIWDRPSNESGKNEQSNFVIMFMLLAACSSEPAPRSDNQWAGACSYARKHDRRPDLFERRRPYNAILT